MIDDDLRTAIETSLSEKVRDARRASGGSIARSFVADLQRSGPIFVKSHPSLGADAFAREAEGLEWLREAGAVRIPRVLATGATASGRGFLVLERIPVASRALGAADEERFGRELAALHRFGAPSFGWDRENLLAVLPQDNRATATFAELYRARRLEPLLARPEAQRLVSAALRARFDALFARLDALVGPPEPPSRLHGDLWAGNRVVDPEGASWLIDPAVYGGHREIDLAMMRLFGGFGSRVFAAYAEAFPLAPGHEARVPLFQLYPLLAHVVMFGAGYLGELEDALEASLRSRPGA